MSLHDLWITVDLLQFAQSPRDIAEVKYKLSACTCSRPGINGSLLVSIVSSTPRALVRFKQIVFSYAMNPSNQPNQYPGQPTRSLSSITDPSQRNSYHSQQDQSSAYQRPQYNTTYQQQMPNVLPHPQSGHPHAYQPQMQAPSQNPGYSGAPGTCIFPIPDIRRLTVLH